MIVKLDVRKSYDRVFWSFLFSILEQFGFDKDWIKCIKNCVSSIHYSIIVNGLVCGVFRASNGLRQGDPLSPFLFVLMAEALGRNIKKLVALGRWRGVSIHVDLNPISHSQFADDTILFGEASEREAKTFKAFLEEYEIGSGQSMNKAKFVVYFINTNKKTQFKIANILGFQIGEFLIKYLGVQLSAGRFQNNIWEEVINKFHSKMVVEK